MQSIIYDVDHVNHLPRLTASLDFGHVLITPVFQNDKFTHYETKIKRGLTPSTLAHSDSTAAAKLLVKNHLSQ